MNVSLFHERTETLVLFLERWKHPPTRGRPQRTEIMLPDSLFGLSIYSLYTKINALNGLTIWNIENDSHVIFLYMHRECKTEEGWWLSLIFPVWHSSPGPRITRGSPGRPRFACFSLCHWYYSILSEFLCSNDIYYSSQIKLLTTRRTKRTTWNICVWPRHSGCTVAPAMNHLLACMLVFFLAVEKKSHTSRWAWQLHLSGLLLYDHVEEKTDSRLHRSTGMRDDGAFWTVGALPCVVYIFLNHSRTPYRKIVDVRLTRNYREVLSVFR